jgi:DNA polymerase-1
MIEFHYETNFKIENEMQRASLRAELAISKSFCFDTETTGLNPHTSELVCMSFAIKANKAYCVLLPNDKAETQKIVDEFKIIFEDLNIEKIGQNIKFDMIILKILLAIWKLTEETLIFLSKIMTGRWQKKKH